MLHRAKQFRTICSANGREISGRFAGFASGKLIESDKVRIERSDGEFFEYPLENLSEADQEIIEAEDGRSTDGQSS